MQIHINDKEHILEIWLSKCEVGDTSVKESLKPLYDRYKKLGYLPVVYMSGKHDLADKTAALLLHNREIMAAM